MGKVLHFIYRSSRRQETKTDRIKEHGGILTSFESDVARSRGELVWRLKGVGVSRTVTSLYTRERSATSNNITAPGISSTPQAALLLCVEMVMLPS